MPACRQAGQSASKPDGRMDGRQVGARAGLQASVCMFTRIFIHANSHSVRLASIHADITTLLRPLILVLLLGSLGIGKRCFESRNNSTNSNPFAGGFLISREISKVSFGLPEGFSVTAEKWQQQGMFRVTRNLSGYSESLTAGLPSEVGQPIFFRIF